MTQQNLEISITRYIDAPPAQVWQAMTERFEEWWCPRPWRAELDAVEWCSGGRFDTTMFGPEGEKMSFKGLLLEVIPGQRMVFTDAMDRDWNPQAAFMIGIMELAPEGSGTRYTGRARHWTEEAKQQHLEMGFKDGWMAASAQLAALVEGEAGECK